MREQNRTFFEKQLEATIQKKDGKVTVIFQRTKVKLRDENEIEFIKTIDPVLQRDIEITEDEIRITSHLPDGFFDFPKIKKKNSMKKRIFALQLINKVQKHTLERLKLKVIPENIAFDPGLTPYFYHYGIKESLPPYEDDPEQLLEEVKATVAVIIDGENRFEEYLRYKDTLKMTDVAKRIMHTSSLEELATLVQELIFDLEKEEAKLIHVPKRRWAIQRYSILVLVFLLVPALFYSFFALFFQIPRQQAYVQSNNHFLRQQYSQVINVLERYEPKDMPYIVQYQLATSYVIHEELTEEQRKNVRSTITLQTDPKYLLYWIYIGRGMNDEAVDLARTMEDQELIIYGLLKLREEIRSDDSLSGKEKQEKIEQIQREIQEFEEEKKRLEEEKRQQEEEENNNEDNGNDSETGETEEEVIEEEQNNNDDEEVNGDTTETEGEAETESETDTDTNEDGQENQDDGQ